ncbi:peptidoglycan DD-metalloendopeptidase family protein [Nocardioides sp. zg-536]|uniref:Peptidoglycan DD-metalloendopeptidase family protein n=1 Tax=Nocardioides faecalis TaxID=2803858 RepID=A0A939BWB1_9ACTN|nr:M23 family metallopeptidase [Nocardioides faecalis]MBM9460841.1 peptidoglycan DD-metalloendopeptidase family protein [Nocardioides faecalis]MBS4754710.1 peptidoglycan DD-metalloendopeptidase family protein [Nocardioides faecalis]QVI58028.1 peptidoglycan DD-metalloendopeptidase family protein [Nocardioides faecalis]
MRFFPSALWPSRALDRLPLWARPQFLVTALVGVVAVAGLAVPLAQADDRNDLKKRQDQVQGKISSKRDEIHEASARVAKISRQLRNARTSLDAARTRLTTVNSRLAKARTAAAALAVKLTQAENALAVAKTDLAKARADVAVQRVASKDAIVTMATGDDARMNLIDSYMSSGTIDDVLMGQTAYDLLTGRQHQALVSLEAAEEAMAERKKKVADARDQVRSAKKAADANVASIASLVQQAAESKAKVLSLVTKTKSARQAVVQARAADQRALRELEKREARIKSRILALSRKQGGSYNGATGGLLARPGPGRITSAYGFRIHPIYGYYGLHNGTDFGTGCGAPLWAGESGTVVNTYYDEVYGNRLYLAIGKVNGATITLVYNHLSSYAVGQGAKVRRGQVVGYSGNTGWSTGCHLHFTVLRNGEPTDPMQYL